MCVCVLVYVCVCGCDCVCGGVCGGVVCVCVDCCWITENKNMCSQNTVLCGSSPAALNVQLLFYCLCFLLTFIF